MSDKLLTVLYVLLMALLLAWAWHSYQRGKEAYYSLGCTMAGNSKAFCDKAAREWSRS